MLDGSLAEIGKPRLLLISSIVPLNEYNCVESVTWTLAKLSLGSQVRGQT